MQVKIYLISRKGRCSRYDCKRKNIKEKIRKFEYIILKTCPPKPLCAK